MNSIPIFNSTFIKFFLILALTAFQQNSRAQTSTLLIKGQLIDQKNQESLPYAHVHNTRTKKGSVTDEQGYFGINGNQIGDTISVSFVGYISQRIVLTSASDLLIKLKENKNQLSEVTLEYDNSEFLYKLIRKCSNNQSQTKAQSKAYYELHTKMDNNQVELVEMFYNAQIKGYDLEELTMKVGKFGVRGNKHGGANISMESSIAILKLNLFKASEYFYKNPFQLSYSRLKKSYDLYKIKEYTEKNETFLVVKFSPKNSDLNLFNGSVWINKTTNQLHKIKLECKNCQDHPFYVVTNKKTTLNQVDMKIVKTFTKKNDEMILDHIDFDYNLNYFRESLKFNLNTNVLVHLYDFEKPFFLPKFNKSNERRPHHDYRLIEEAPYNTFFWENHDEFEVFDKANENETFYNHPKTIKGTDFGSSLNLPQNMNNNHFEHPSFRWSKKRLRFSEPKQKPTSNIGNKEKIKQQHATVHNTGFKAYAFKFYGKIYLDRNEYNGEINIITKSIFDSSRSYYKLPVDWKVQVFVNMYFDLVEIERRKLEKEIEASDKSILTIEQLYTSSEFRLAKIHNIYLKEMQRGENKEAMEKWNSKILSALKINNIEAFLKE